MLMRTAIHPLKILAAVGMAFVLWGLVLASPAHAATLTVNSNADTTDSDGCTTDPGGCTLREAINAANASSGEDTINFNLGQSAIIALDSQLSLPISDPAGLTIDGGSADITVSGKNAVRVFFVGSDAKLTLNKLTVANGNATDLSPFGSVGGGIFNAGTITVNNSTLSGNSASDDGGGIYNFGGTLTINSSTLSGNRTSSGGGGILTNGGTLTINSSTLSGNSASDEGGGDGDGGGIFIAFGTITINSSTLSDNSASDEGGGIDSIGSSTLTVGNATLSGNRASFGGGIFNNGSTLRFDSSTLSGNRASSGGGGIWNNGGGATLKNTIVANSTDLDGTTPQSNCRGTITDGGYNLDSGNTCGFDKTDPTKHSLYNTDPKLGPLADNGGPTKTYALLARSPAKDKGNSDLDTDQRGEPRPFDDPGIAPADGGDDSDIGAYEVEVEEDNTAPVVTVPGPITNEATSPDGAVVTFNATAEDAVDGSVDVTCTPPSGSTFPIGTTSVSCSATDAAGNTSTETFFVTVEDNTAPSITAPPNITVEATGPNGAVVQYGTNQDNSCSASDIVDPNLTLNYSPPSGSTFPIGNTFVTCTAMDSSGNSSSATFTVTVEDTTSPTFLSKSPLDGATRVSRTNPDITATFSEPMTFPANSFILQKVKVQGKRETVLDTVTTSVENPADQSTPNVVRLALGDGVTLDKGSYYRVTITTDATDRVGNPLEGEETWRFKTAPK